VLETLRKNNIRKLGYERKEDEWMPSYGYRCPKCKKKFTAIISIGEHDAGKVKCPKCGRTKWNNSSRLFW